MAPSKKKYAIPPAEAAAFEEAWHALNSATRNFRSKDDVRMGWMLCVAAQAARRGEDRRAALRCGKILPRYDWETREKVGVYTLVALTVELVMTMPTDLTLDDALAYVTEAVDCWNGQTMVHDPLRDIEVVSVAPTGLDEAPRRGE